MITAAATVTGRNLTTSIVAAKVWVGRRIRRTGEPARTPELPTRSAFSGREKNIVTSENVAMSNTTVDQLGMSRLLNVTHLRTLEKAATKGNVIFSRREPPSE